MALVDYASSSEEEDEEKEVNDEEDKDEKPANTVPAQPPRAAFSSPRPTSNDVPTSSTSSTERLPDASLLLESPSLPSYGAVSLGGHSSIIAAARAENMSRKRESNGSAFSNPPNKLPRRDLLNSRNGHSAAAAGTLVPPQLSGRSNVVTEDMGRLFVNRHANPPH